MITMSGVAFGAACATTPIAIGARLWAAVMHDMWLSQLGAIATAVAIVSWVALIADVSVRRVLDGQRAIAREVAHELVAAGGGAAAPAAADHYLRAVEDPADSSRPRRG